MPKKQNTTVIPSQKVQLDADSGRSNEILFNIHKVSFLFSFVVPLLTSSWFVFHGILIGDDNQRNHAEIKEETVES